MIGWFGPYTYTSINGCIKHFITQFVHCSQYGYPVKVLCYFRDRADPFVFTSTKIVQLIEYLCTIIINYFERCYFYFSLL